ncbi:MAG: DUF2500 domain-containing protein [Defluviitaleaceae bacterium]|nr:DUF2500 domain-containing protein [Defluviitaleaceae bacterium]
MSVFEFYSWLGVNPYVYIGIFAAVAVVFLIIALIISSFFSKRLYESMEGNSSFDILSVKAAITEIGIPKRREVSIVFTDEEGTKHIFSLPRIQGAFLQEGAEGMLKFKGSKFISFLPPEEEASSEDSEEA